LSFGLLLGTISSFERSMKAFSRGICFVAIGVAKVWWNLLRKAVISAPKLR